MSAPASKEAQAFYEHKRHLHSGAFDNGCPTCRKLWDKYLAASKRKAGGVSAPRLRLPRARDPRGRARRNPVPRRRGRDRHLGRRDQ